MSGLSRGLRRLRARWRLHQMEWNLLHRSLEIPPGFEEYHTPLVDLRGAREKLKGSVTWSGFRRVCRRYRDTWNYNGLIEGTSELGRELKEERERVWRERRRSREEGKRVVIDRLDSGRKRVTEELETLRSTASQSAENLRSGDLKDGAGSFVQNCAKEFVAGYREGQADQKELIDSALWAEHRNRWIQVIVETSDPVWTLISTRIPGATKSDPQDATVKDGGSSASARGS
mmetsp:Transcript_3536/g.6694  ORF Transcript_3536/g.6694 Transcript_3536/m.6694 type:complete len:231 (-) Transcript_3536:3210-3902(-)